MNYWNREAQRVFRSMLARAGISRKGLVDRLAEIGVTTSEAAIANRVYRGTLSFAFVLQVAAALGFERLELSSATIAEQRIAQTSGRKRPLSLTRAASIREP